MAFQRGEIWAYEPVLARQGQSLARLLVSADGLNQSTSPTLIGMDIVDSDPGNLLAVGIEAQGWAVVTSIQPVMRRRLTSLIGVASLDEMHAVAQALKAALDLE